MLFAINLTWDKTLNEKLVNEKRSAATSFGQYIHSSPPPPRHRQERRDQGLLDVKVDRGESAIRPGLQDGPDGLSSDPETFPVLFLGRQLPTSTLPGYAASSDPPEMSRAHDDSSAWTTGSLGGTARKSGKRRKSDERPTSKQRKRDTRKKQWKTPLIHLMPSPRIAHRTVPHRIVLHRSAATHARGKILLPCLVIASLAGTTRRSRKNEAQGSTTVHPTRLGSHFSCACESASPIPSRQHPRKKVCPADLPPIDVHVHVQSKATLWPPALSAAALLSRHSSPWPARPDATPDGQPALYTTDTLQDRLLLRTSPLPAILLFLTPVVSANHDTPVPANPGLPVLPLARGLGRDFGHSFWLDVVPVYYATDASQ
ncbi:hypothetical protein CMUS01_15563 [Colletotrichum musicola]|uniref:Uncharacterized protein n=1 Tax=Colletotrichum musicola TaxID=2175873 RepID=A0A8H6MMU0_9PEZI|nr:hypothetical protein CMUS01_15563 [Colletotrichum musicola]